MTKTVTVVIHMHHRSPLDPHVIMKCSTSTSKASSKYFVDVDPASAHPVLVSRGPGGRLQHFQEQHIGQFLLEVSANTLPETGNDSKFPSE